MPYIWPYGKRLFVSLLHKSKLLEATKTKRIEHKTSEGREEVDKGRKEATQDRWKKKELQLFN